MSTTITIEEINQVIEISGSQGPVGPQGPEGPAGESYIHTQSSASNTWLVNHNLGFKPSVEILSSGGAEIEGEVLHTSNNQTIITFNSSITGSARFV